MCAWFSWSSVIDVHDTKDSSIHIWYSLFDDTLTICRLHEGNIPLRSVNKLCMNCSQRTTTLDCVVHAWVFSPPPVNVMPCVYAILFPEMYKHTIMLWNAWMCLQWIWEWIPFQFLACIFTLFLMTRWTIRINPIPIPCMPFTLFHDWQSENKTFKMKMNTIPIACIIKKMLVTLPPLISHSATLRSLFGYNHEIGFSSLFYIRKIHLLHTQKVFKYH